ncbi:MAG: hypothetical protein ABI652_06510 [Acidobacteriota bacterium]
MSSAYTDVVFADGQFHRLECPMVGDTAAYFDHAIRVPVDECLLFARLAGGNGRLLAAGQGSLTQPSRLIVCNDLGAQATIGTSIGTQCVAAAFDAQTGRFVVASVRNGAQYTVFELTPDLTVISEEILSLPSGTAGTSQGMLDMSVSRDAAGKLIADIVWTDLQRSVDMGNGVQLILWMRRGPWRIGQFFKRGMPDQVAVCNDLTGEWRTVYGGETSVPSRIAIDLAGTLCAAVSLVAQPFPAFAEWIRLNPAVPPPAAPAPAPAPPLVTTPLSPPPAPAPVAPPVPPPVPGVPVNTDNIFQTLTSLRAEYPGGMSNDQCVELLNRAAFLHRAEGWCLLLKEGGNNGARHDGTRCSVDWLVTRETGADFLSDAGAGGPSRVNNPGELPPHADEAARWIAPIAPAGSGAIDPLVRPTTPVAPAVAPVPVAPAIDPAVIAALQASLENIAKRQELIFGELERRIEACRAEVAQGFAAIAEQLSAEATGQFTIMGQSASFKITPKARE